MVRDLRYENLRDELTKSDRVIFDKDKQYRNNAIIKYFYKTSRNSEIDFQYFFCNYLDIKSLGKQIKGVFDSNNFNINSFSFPDKFNLLCDIYSKDIKLNFVEPCPKFVRDVNIKKINLKQESDISESKFESEIQKMFEKSNFKIVGRSLVLYFRYSRHVINQVDYLQFSIIYYILDWYINSGYSRCFDNLSIVSRNPNEYPHYLNDLFSNVNYLNYRNENYLFVSGVGSNIVHFCDGDYNEHNNFYSVPIVSESIGKSENNFFKRDFVKLKGIYFDKNNELVKDSIFGNIFNKKDRNNGNFTKLMQTMLFAVVELEDKMLKNVEK